MQFGRYMKWGLVVLLALLARSELEPAWADENEDFRRHYEQAIGLYDRGKYEESIAAFQKAYACVSSPLAAEPGPALPEARPGSRSAGLLRAVSAR